MYEANDLLMQIQNTNTKYTDGQWDTKHKVITNCVIGHDPVRNEIDKSSSKIPKCL